MGFLSLFKLKLFDPKLFDKELTSLTQAISRTRSQISGLTNRQKSFRKTTLWYSLVVYISWIAYRYKVALDNMGILAAGKGRFAVFFEGQLFRDLVVLFVFPGCIAALLFLIEAGFQLLVSSKDKNLKALLKKHKEKIEELKNITNFNTTNELLNKYGKLSIQAAPAAISPSAQKANIKGSVSGPKHKLPSTIIKSTHQEKPMATGIAPGIAPAKSVLTLVASPQAHAHRTFQDRLLDYVIGSENNESVENRYALICVNCYTHNGLAPPGCTDPLSVTYICRQCGFINGQFQEGSSVNTENNIPIEKTEGGSLPVHIVPATITSSDETTPIVPPQDKSSTPSPSQQLEYLLE